MIPAGNLRICSRGGVERIVESESYPPQSRTRGGTNLTRVLTDTAGENQGIDTAERCGHRADPFPQPGHIEVEGEQSTRISRGSRRRTSRISPEPLEIPLRPDWW